MITSFENELLQALLNTDKDFTALTCEAACQQVSDVVMSDDELTLRQYKAAYLVIFKAFE